MSASALVPRGAAEVVADLRTAAARSALPRPDGAPLPWDALLFVGNDWADATEPSQALLQAFAELQAALAQHLQTVPRRIETAWFHDRLRIAPLPGVSDRVVVAATAEPARSPIAVAAGTAVRAKDSAKRERRYTTTETLTVHGVELLGLYAHGATVRADGSVHDTVAEWSDRGAPFVPFDVPSAAHLPFAGRPAAHQFFVLSDLIAFGSGSMTVRLDFAGSVDARALDDAVWHFPQPGGVGTATLVASGASFVALSLTGGCVAPDDSALPLPYLVATLPDCPDAALRFAPEAVTVRVADRRNVAVDAVFANDGKLDPSKEMAPFGPTPRRGDAFYVRSDEAFGKPLEGLAVDLSRMDSGADVLHGVSWSVVPDIAIAAAYDEVDDLQIASAFKQQVRAIIGAFSADADPEIDWQAYDGREWVTLGSTGSSLESFAWTGTAAADEPRSAPIALGGGGHFVRAFLAEGDFGWAAYQKGIGEFAAEASKGPSGHPDPAKLVPPDPPIVTSVSVAYRTLALAPASMLSIDGWTTRHWTQSGAHKLFALPFELGAQSGAGGMVALGLRVGAAALGSAVSLYVDIASAPACGSGPDSPLRWEAWTETGWRALTVADGTHGLRQPGLLRFVAPLDWPEGCDATSAAAGRWIRAVTTDIETVGAIVAVVPDAVEAVQVAGTVYEPLEKQQVKGLLATPPGLKKLTNPIPGTPGRPPEVAGSDAYVRRASGAVRHRWRALAAWDCEELIRAGTPELAAVRCLPHTGPHGEISPGWIGAVVVPRSSDRLPLPGISLAERIREQLRPSLPVQAQLAILCPLYVQVTINAAIVLVPGVAALDARTAIMHALEDRLHPAGSEFGRELFASSLAAWIESRPEVDSLEAFQLLADGAETERVTVDRCRGLVASAGNHAITFRESL